MFTFESFMLHILLQNLKFLQDKSSTKMLPRGLLLGRALCFEDRTVNSIKPFDMLAYSAFLNISGSNAVWNPRRLLPVHYAFESVFFSNFSIETW